MCRCMLLWLLFVFSCWPMMWLFLCLLAICLFGEGSVQVFWSFLNWIVCFSVDFWEFFVCFRYIAFVRYMASKYFSTCRLSLSLFNLSNSLSQAQPCCECPVHNHSIVYCSQGQAGEIPHEWAHSGLPWITPHGLDSSNITNEYVSGHHKNAPQSQKESLLLTEQFQGKSLLTQAMSPWYPSLLRTFPNAPSSV